MTNYAKCFTLSIESCSDSTEIRKQQCHEFPATYQTVFKFKFNLKKIYLVFMFKRFRHLMSMSLIIHASTQLKPLTHVIVILCTHNLGLINANYDHKGFQYCFKMWKKFYCEAEKQFSRKKLNAWSQVLVTRKTRRDFLFVSNLKYKTNCCKLNFNLITEKKTGDEIAFEICEIEIFKQIWKHMENLFYVQLSGNCTL